MGYRYDLHWARQRTSSRAKSDVEDCKKGEKIRNKSDVRNLWTIRDFVALMNIYESLLLRQETAPVQPERCGKNLNKARFYDETRTL